MNQTERTAGLGKEERRNFEDFLAELSVRFSKLSAQEVDGAIENAQRLFCEALGLDRSCLYQHFDLERDSLVLTHLYQSQEGVLARWSIEKRVDWKLLSNVYWFVNEAGISARVDVKPLFPWVYKQMEQRQAVIISDLKELPEQASHDLARFVQYGTKSAVIMALAIGGDWLGCISFETVEKSRKWTQTDLIKFRCIADVFTNALLRKRTDEALRETGERLRIATEATGFGAFTYDFAARRGSYSPEHMALFGLPPDGEFELDPDMVPKAVHPEEKPLYLSAMLAAGNPHGPGQVNLEFRIKRLDNGEVRWLSMRARTTFTKTGTLQPVRSHGILQDITARKLAEEALRKSYEEIKLLKDRLQVETAHLRAETKTNQGHGQLLGRSRGIKGVLHNVEQVAPVDCAVLIRGETGTGKELIAQEIHRLSKRRDRAMVLVNCAALPCALVESELFGRERGAYTGALTSQVGRFEMANGSTIFLDEVGELSMEVQAKLLRVLQQGEFQRLGSPKTHMVDVRVLAATNRDLAQEVRKGRFREDLYYRLNVFPIEIPPLRERVEDITLMVFAFMEEFQTRMGKKITKVPRKAMEALEAHSWPGNIRELRNVIEHSVILTSGDTLKLTALGDSPVRVQPVTLAEAEREHILRALESTGWRIKGPHGAAYRLNVQPSTLYSRMLKLGIPHRRQKDEMAANGSNV